MMISPKIIPQKRRRLIQVNDQYVDITVVIKITESTAATGVFAGKSRPSFRQSLKTPIAEIAQESSWTLVRIVRKLFLKLRIDASRHEEDIWPSIVIEIEDSSAPTDVLAFRP